MSLLESYKENGLKYFTPKRAWLWIRSKIYALIGYKIKQKHAIAFAEIVTYKSLTCPECVQLGKCKKCKCPINELFISMDAPCSLGKFPAFKEKIDWFEFFDLIKKRKFKNAFKELNVKHWSEVWKKYKEVNKVFLTKFYG